MVNDIAHPSAGAGDQDDTSGREISRVGGQFLASLNHEIRTPLSGIMGITDLLLETELSREQLDYVQTTRLCADQLMEMLNSALEFAALSAGSPKLEKTEFHLPETLRGLVEEFLPKAEAKGLTLARHLDEELPEYVLGDAVRLRQTLSPLLANALKFTSSGEIEVTATANGNSNHKALLSVSVRDTGIGIPESKLTTIFESFRQVQSGLSRTYTGLGLGLAVARELSKLMDGDISVESKLGEGSTFRLTVPLDLAEQTAGESESSDGHAHPEEAHRQRILLVDDNEVARRVVTHILGRADYFVHCAEGGRKGIEAASKYSYDLILMDLQMPDINGMEATAAIRKLPGYAHIPILALSANYSEEFRKQCQESGMRDFLSKPIQGEVLLKTIERYLQS